MVLKRLAASLLLSVVMLSGCGSGEGDEGANNSIPAASAAYIVVAWNDLGMHCLNPSYDTAVILPPYNTVMAQVVKRGAPPTIATAGLTVSYRILNNTSSSNKGLYGQFWTYATTLFQSLFPTMASPLPANVGLTGNGLSGAMKAVGSHFEVTGIPVVPYEDGSSVRNPYQVAEITVKDAGGAIVAQTQVTVPTSDEINCGKCHRPGGTQTQIFNDILIKHDLWQGTNLSRSTPVLCASCHGSPALGTTGPGSSGKYLSQAIHSFHAGPNVPVKPTCYDCHPGASTKCNRSTKHTAADGNCVACHGDLANVAATIASGSRVPWESEPKCVTCHAGVAQVDTGTILYRNAVGHGGIYCAGCHGSPHAMYPVDTTSDKTGNYQAVQYQGVPYALGDCRACHTSSRGGGNNFAGEHRNRTSACNVCHTGFVNAGNTASYPHQFQWKSR